MVSAALAIRTFMRKNPQFIEKSLILKKEIGYCIYLWAIEDPIKIISSWNNIFGKDYQVRVAHSSMVATQLNSMYDSAVDLLPAQGVRCKAR